MITIVSLVTFYSFTSPTVGQLFCFFLGDDGRVSEANGSRDASEITEQHGCICHWCHYSNTCTKGILPPGTFVLQQL